MFYIWSCLCSISVLWFFLGCLIFSFATRILAVALVLFLLDNLIFSTSLRVVHLRYFCMDFLGFKN